MKKIIDVCCGSKMFWFDKNNPDVLFCDKRRLRTTLSDGRELTIEPDIRCDFKDLPFKDNKFYLAVFDPPHLINVGSKSWLAKKYGKLNKDTWKEDIKQGFDECMRVLKPNGILIFKWNETDIPVSKIISVVNCQPLFGHRVGKLNKTHWLCFMKSEVEE